MTVGYNAWFESSIQFFVSFSVCYQLLLFGMPMVAPISLARISAVYIVSYACFYRTYFGQIVFQFCEDPVQEFFELVQCSSLQSFLWSRTLRLAAGALAGDLGLAFASSP